MTAQGSENRPYSGASPERRIHARLALQFDPRSVLYAEMGDGKFGIVTNISEGGLAMQTVSPILREEIPNLCFRLSPTGNLIRPTARVAWKTVSKNTAGVQFLSMSKIESIELRNWISAQGPPAGRKQRVDGGQVATATPDSDPVLTDRFESLQQIQAERTIDHGFRRKLLGWTIAVVLASVLVASLLVLKRWTPGTAFAQLRAVSNWSSTAAHSILERTADWARSAVPQVPRGQFARSGFPRKLTSSAEPKKETPPDSPSTEAALPSEPLEDSKPNSPALNPSSSTSTGCRNLSNEAFPLGGDGQRGDTKMQETTDPADGEPVLTIQPTYPITDAQSCVDGTVRLHAIIDANGAVQSLKPVSGPPTLFNAAIAAARYWRFEPTMRAGQAVGAEHDIQVVFKNMLADTR